MGRHRRSRSSSTILPADVIVVGRTRGTLVSRDQAVDDSRLVEGPIDTTAEPGSPWTISAPYASGKMGRRDSSKSGATGGE